MAFTETTCKVTYVGTWHEDSFTDEVMKSIATHAEMDKGKKVKLVLNKEGIKISKSKIFQQNHVEFYPYDKIRGVSRNPRFENCILFIMDGQEKKNKIVAIRCPSDSNSIYIVNRASQLRQNVRSGNVEFRKQENGNWTLRERSVHNANMHLKEIFKEQQENATNGNTANLNGDIYHMPVLDRSKEPVRNNSDIKRNGSVTQGIVVRSNDISPSTDIHATKDDGIRDADDLKDLMDHCRVADSLKRRGTLPSKPAVTTSQTDGPILLRAPSKTYSVGPQPQPMYYNQWAPHRRFSGDFVIPPQRNRKLSSTSSLRTNNESVPHKTMSMRIRPFTAVPFNYSTSTTIQRSIEDTYGRPVLVPESRRVPINPYRPVMSRQHRPSSIHVMGGNQLRVYQPEDGTNVAL